MRVTLFTDTLGDINGVSRFIRNMAQAADRTGRDLHVITSTRFPTPHWPNVFNFEPVVAGTVPRYENLEVCLPPRRAIRQHLERFPPDVVHVSTPGPVGLVGRGAARRLGVPLLGVYHTDFPAYVDGLFDDAALTWTTAAFMRWFYKPFAAVFTRSADYVESLVRLGMAREQVLPLLAGVDTAAFDARYRDQRVWERFPGVDPLSVRVLYVGRVSVEKNLPFLAGVWGLVRGALEGSGRSAELIVVGDGPYRAAMEKNSPARARTSWASGTARSSRRSMAPAICSCSRR
jgi:glycosyltransferase involved in cell wall biosynthesis